MAAFPFMVGLAGEGEEDVVEVGRVDGEAVDLDGRCVEPVEQVRSDRTLPSLGTCRDERVVVAGGSAEERRRPQRVPSGSVNCRRMWPPGMRRLSSSGVPSAISLPWSSTAIRSASWSASSRYWVVRKIVTPSATRSRMICHIVRRLRGSRPVVGSSRKMMRGSPTRVIARSSRRRMPPE